MLMKFLMALAFCGALAVQAGNYYDWTLTVTGGATTASDTINVYSGVDGIGASAVDTFAVVSAGSQTGTVTYARADFGVAASAFTYSYVLATNTVYSAYPARSETSLAGTVTNLYPYVVRKVKVTVTQPSTGADQTWKGAIYTR